MLFVAFNPLFKSRGFDLILGIASEEISQEDCTEGRLATGLTIFLVTGLRIIGDMSWRDTFCVLNFA
jgi:hypothetical protein